jgi:hypothetical protein
MSTPGPKNQICVRNGIVVWLDVDDVLVDCHGQLNDFFRQKGYDTPPDFIPQKYSYLDVMSLGDFNRYLAELGISWIKKAEAFKGADKFTKKLKILGAHIVLATSIDGIAAPERITNLRENGIYRDEFYPTRGRSKADFINSLVPLYVDPRGRPAKHIFCDDYAKNCLEFLEHVPAALKAFTLDIGYSKEWIEKANDDPRLDSASRTPQELYRAVLKFIAKTLIGKIGEKKRSAR